MHWYAGRSQAQIADSLGLDRKTVRKYLAPVTAEGLVPGGPPVMTEADWRAWAASWFPALVDKGLRQVTWPAIDAHRDYVTAQLKAQVTVSTIYQRLVDEHALVASVASLRRWVGANLPEEARRAAVRVLRPGPVEPGSEAQIDYGRLGMWTDPATGRRHTVQAFVMVLACSRYMFVRPVLRDGPGGVDPLPRRGVRVLRKRPRPGWSRTTSRPGWTSRTCTTRRSTAEAISRRSWAGLSSPSVWVIAARSWSLRWPGWSCCRRRAGVLAVSYFFATLAPVRILLTSFCCGRQKLVTWHSSCQSWLSRLSSRVVS